MLGDLRQADLDSLSGSELAAIEAREKWLLRARTSKRKGKQIPPDGDWRIMLALAGRGWGKLLALDTPIPTPAGWTTMGDIEVGAEVFDESGRVCRVTWASAPQTPVEAYRLFFSDGSVIEACAEHQWVTWTHAERKAFLRSPYEETHSFPPEWPAWRLKRWRTKRGEAPCGPQVRTTAEIVETLKYGKRGDTNHCIPQTLPLALRDRYLPVPPYTLGVWLGDGSSGDGGITCHEDDQDHLCRMIEQDGFRTRKTPSDSQRIGTEGLRRLLRSNGLLRNKHIPPVYLRASASQRLALLRGLMDSDGGRDYANLVSFTNTNEALADAVAELAVSLGQKVTRDDRIPICGNNGKPGARAFRVSFTPTIQIFALPRKAETISFGGAQSLRRHHRMIEGAEPISGIPMRCITVDSRHSTYLAGRSMIPTHNTETVSQAVWWECWRVPGIIANIVAPTISDVNGTNFEGPAGFRASVPAECLYRGSWELAFVRQRRELRFSNGSIIRGFGAQEEASRLRGPQCHILAGDELREWDRPAGNLELSINNALYGLRLPYPDGTPSRAIFATTKKPIPFLKRLAKQAGVLLVVGTSYENLENLSQTYREHLLAQQGTLLGRQEIDNAWIDEESDGSIIKRNWIKLWPARKKLPAFETVVAGVDAAATEDQFDKKTQQRDPTGVGIFGVFNVKQAFNEEEFRKLGVKGRYAALLIDYWAERLGLPDLLERARKIQQQRWGTPPRKIDIWLIEQASSGPGMRQFLSKWGVPTWPSIPRGDKAMRLHNVAPLILQGGLFVPESLREDRKGMVRDWVETPFLEELCAFAGEGSTEHDESCDIVSSVFRYLHDRGLLDAKPDKPYIDREAEQAAKQEEAEKVYEQQRQISIGNWYS